MCDEAIHEEVYKGYKISIRRDNNPYNPREDDNFGTIVAFHRRYNFSDRNPYEDTFNADQFSSWEEFEAYLNRRGYFWLPLYLYDHSVQSISTESFVGRAVHAEWDSGRLGFILVHKDKVRAEYGVKHISQKTIEKVFRILRAEVSEFDSCIQGEVYGYEVINPKGELVDSCWGFIDGEDYALEEAKRVVDYQ